MRRPGSMMLALACTGVVAALLAVPASGAAPEAPAAARRAVSKVFTELESPAIPCVVKTAAEVQGQRWCTTTVDTEPTRVQSFDDTPIDAAVYLPPAPGGGVVDGDYPLVAIFHGWGGHKASGQTARRWLDAGYAVFSMTARGWYASCGEKKYRNDLPDWADCDDGDINFFDYRYEARDAQFLIGQLVDEGLVDPDRIGLFGGSYGGIASSTIAALNTRIVTGLDDSGQPVYAPWTSPSGVPLHIAGAAPAALGSDLIYTQQPNGSTLDYVADSPYFRPDGSARVGVQKADVMNGFLNGVKQRGTLSPQITLLQRLANGPGPYDPMRELVEQTVATHSAYNVEDSVAPPPMILADGWNDDFVGPDEAIKYYNKIRADHPGVPVAMYFGDVGHPRSLGKPDDDARQTALRQAWMDYYVRDRATGTRPPQNVQMNAFSCTPDSGASTTIGTWAEAAKGEVRVSSTTTKTIAATGGNDGEGFNGKRSACVTIDPAQTTGAASYRTPVAQDGGYDIRGAAMVHMLLTVPGASDQIVARLLDVAPDGRATLVQRGLMRPEVGASSSVQYLQLHPNSWHVADGHRLLLQLLPSDDPYSHVNATGRGDAAAQHPIQVRRLELRVPTVQAAGASGGQVVVPRKKWLPPGFTAAPGFAALTTTTPPF